MTDVRTTAEEAVEHDARAHTTARRPVMDSVSLKSQLDALYPCGGWRVRHCQNCTHAQNSRGHECIGCIVDGKVGTVGVKVQDIGALAEVEVFDESSIGPDTGAHFVMSVDCLHSDVLKHISISVGSVRRSMGAS